MSMLRLSPDVEVEPACEGFGVLRVASDPTVPEHRRGMDAFARRLGFTTAAFGRSRELAGAVHVNAWFRRRAARLAVPGFGEVLSMGRFAAASPAVQRRAVMAPPRDGTETSLASRLGVSRSPSIGGSVGEALNRPSQVPVVAFDEGTVLFAAAAPGPLAVLDWVDRALREGTLRFSHGPGGFAFLAPGSPVAAPDA